MRLLSSFILPFLLSSLATAQDDFLKQMDSQIPLGGDQSGHPVINSSGPPLSDLLTIEPSTSIFFTYARETTTGKLLNEDNARITVFAPTNDAVMALARKPHEGPQPQDGTIISEEEFETRSRENIERWIQAHIVPLCGLQLVPTSQFETLAEGVGITVYEGSDWTGDYPEGEPVWKHILLNEKISIKKEAKASNGILYVIDHTIYG